MLFQFVFCLSLSTYLFLFINALLYDISATSVNSSKTDNVRHESKLKKALIIIRN